jgi:hypothetical protein
MSKRHLALAAIALLISAAPALAQNGKFNSIGAGNYSCGTWTAERRDPYSRLGSFQDEQWVLGFLSGIGYMGAEANPLNGTDAQGVLAWIDNYCWVHPLEEISGAAKAFYSVHPR